MMAGDWIKFEVATSDKPEVWAIAESLKIDPDAVVGKLLRVWAWFDKQTESGNAPRVSMALLDRAVGVSGFCRSMIEAGWMSETNFDGQTLIELPNFDRHNGKTAKTRALTARRVAKHEKANAQTNGSSVCESLVETKNTNADRVTKRREEKRRVYLYLYFAGRRE